MKKFALILAALLSGCSTASPTMLGYASTPSLLSAQSMAFSAQKAQNHFKRDLLGLVQRYHAPLLKRDPSLIQLKYQAMAADPFAFYRATAFLYYVDMQQATALQTPVKVHLQGDFHLENMGTYFSSNGQIAYDLNDFDESFAGPYTWDIARMATSIHLAAAQQGMKRKDREQWVEYFLERYLQYLQNPGNLEMPLTQVKGKAEKAIAETHQQSRQGFVAKQAPNGQFQGSKYRPLHPQTQAAVSQSVARYAATRPEGPQYYRIKDAKSRIAGKGSLGRYRYNVLIEGATPSAHDDHILEIKEAITPSAYAFSAPWPNNAQRIAQSYRYFLPGADSFLGSTQIHGLDAFVRERLPDESVNLAKVNKSSEYRDLLDNTALIAARAHARSGQAQSILQDARSPKAFKKRVGGFAQDYFEQVQADYKLFRQNMGRL